VIAVRLRCHEHLGVGYVVAPANAAGYVRVAFAWATLTVRARALVASPRCEGTELSRALGDAAQARARGDSRSARAALRAARSYGWAEPRLTTVGSKDVDRE